VRRAQFFDQTSWLPDNLLERRDRMMMAASIEGRVPFLDVELARLVARLPSRFLIGHPKGKAVLRAAMAGTLPARSPDAIRSHSACRSTNGFATPTGTGWGTCSRVAGRTFGVFVKPVKSTSSQ
jgi:asparagine synthetase B (glutamine-hydrolysing)